MQISRHWRMNSNRYRLDGVRIPTSTPEEQKYVTAQREKRIALQRAEYAQRGLLCQRFLIWSMYSMFLRISNPGSLEGHYFKNKEVEPV